MDLDLQQLVRVARHWWWLLVLGALIAGFTAYSVSSRQQPLYSTSATLLINPAQNAGDVDFAGIQGSQRLAVTYQQLVNAPDVLEPVIADLGLPFDVNTLEGMVSASVGRDSLLLRISVSDTDPERAALIADAVAEQFAAYVAQQAIDLGSISRAALDEQKIRAEERIAGIEAEIAVLQQRPDAATSDVQAQISALRRDLDEVRASQTAVLLQEQQLEFNAATASTRLTVTHQAKVPTGPYEPRVLLYTLLGAFAGLLIAAGAVGLLEFLDNTVKASTNFPALAGGPLLAAIGTMSRLRDGQNQLYVRDQPKSTPAEAIRLLRTNLEFAALTKEIETLAISSAGPSEGKSTVTANLGVAMAQAGYSVVIIDADLRRPSQHRIFGIGNERGLTTLMTHPDQTWTWVATDIIPSKLSLISSGPLPPNPADLLSLDQLRLLLNELRKTVDIVLLDTPPILAVSDPLVVSTYVDGVVLVCHAGRTRLEALRRAAEALQQGTVRIVGVVLNQRSGRDADGYYYYDGYYEPESTDEAGPSLAPASGTMPPVADRKLMPKLLRRG